MKRTITRSILAAVAAGALSTFSLQAQTAVTTTTATSSAGTISEFSPDAIVIHSETSTSPMHYRYTKSTTYVDEAGAPVSIETVKSGLPVTVYYTGTGDNMVATKVVVRKAVTTGGDVIEKKTKTTTTTDHD